MPNEFKQGEHICCVYDTADEQRSVAARYLADGLRRGERCLYVADSRDALEQFRISLGEAGIDAEAAAGSGALIEKTCAEVHLLDGTLDCERMLNVLGEAVEAALNDGFQGLRACGDMSWLLDHAPGSDQVVAYEALLNQFFKGVRAGGMCLYDRQRLPVEMIDHAFATHSTAIVNRQHQANPLYRPASIAARSAARPSDLHWQRSEPPRRS
jgi:hypothetical protein